MIFPLWSDLYEPQTSLWLLNSPTKINAFSSCLLMFYMSGREKSLWFGMFMWHMVNLMWGTVTEIAITSRSV